MGHRLLIKLYAGVILGIVVLGSATSQPSGNIGTVIEEQPLYDDNDAYCLASFDDNSVDKSNMTAEWYVSSTFVYSEDFENVPNGSYINSTLERSNYSRNQEVLCNVTITEPGSVEDWESDNVITDTFPPSISGPEFQNYSDEHSFNVSAVLLDRESDDEIRDCWLEAEGESGPSISIPMSLDRTYGDGEQAKCHYSKLSNFTLNFDVLEEINVTVYANDSGGDVTNSSNINPVPNSKPRVFDVSPTNDAVVSSDSVDLQLRVEDQDNEKMNVKFIDITSSPPSILDDYSGISPGSEVSTSWPNLDQLKTYYWRINVSDSHQETSIRYRFRNQFPSQFRVDTGFETQYNSVLMSPNNSRLVRYTVKNGASQIRNDLVTTTYGADSIISSTSSDSSNPYSLSPGESRTFNIEISPDTEGLHSLVVATSSGNYNINTSESIDIYVDDRPGAVADVPGIGVFQMLFLIIFSTLYYSVRL